ncbi:hypothetical protein IKG33_03570 [Candidatus Saccharibacteria bacterium]|nr:hypothetical protein [Candidatus Saccharibacteria bacterium]
MKIAIIGAGAFGTALGGILANNGYDIDYYDSKLEREKLSETLKGSGYVVLCVPSKVVPYLVSHLPKDKPLIVATKGILSDKTFADFRDLMILSGPGFASEIKLKKKAKLTVTDKRVAELFKADYLDFDFTDDKLGVLMCGALKNVYAIYAGILGLERETKAWREFIRGASEEMQALLSTNGARAETVNLACGIEDLKLTCGLPSRNYEYGQILSKNPDAKPEKTVEGLTALAKIKRGEIKVPEGLKILEELMRRIEWD